MKMCIAQDTEKGQNDDTYYTWKDENEEQAQQLLKHDHHISRQTIDNDFPESTDP